jgi:peptidyl-tRNA hydrolase, PTH1 family
MAENARYLFVGLGNPGKGYVDTRHNVGFRSLEFMAGKYGWAFRKVKSLHGLLAEGVIEGKKVFLLLPETYMNSSGEAVRACVSYYDIPFSQICVVCDDINIPFGRIRLKSSGSSGGHNGLKSLASHLGGESYARLRIGVGDREHGDLADYVLSAFKAEEKQKLPEILSRASDGLECFLTKGIVEAMQFANACQEEDKPEKKLGE